MRITDAGGGWIARCDWLASIPQISFREYDVPAMLPRALGIAPAHVSQAPSPDGDSPVRHINDAANAIGSGAASVCILTGGEAVRTSLRRAAAAGNTKPLFAGAVATATDLRRRYGLITPADIYPLYENAARAAWGQTLAEGQANRARSGRACRGCRRVRRGVDQEAPIRRKSPTSTPTIARLLFPMPS